MGDRLLFVTSNAGKLREVQRILDYPVEQLDLDLPEIQALDVADVVRAKALAGFAHTRRPVMVEDTGLYIDALRGLPGALVRWFLLTIGPAGICELIPEEAERRATARSAVAFCHGDTVQIFPGETRGEIALAPSGSGGFGWDSIFRPDGATQTFAEMGQDEKNRFSMRRRALVRLRDEIGLTPG